MKYPSEIVKEVAVYQCGTRGSCLCCNYCVGDISRENYVWNLPGERSGKKSWTRTVPWGPQYTVVSGVKVLDLSSCFLFCFLTLNTFYLFIFGCTTWFVGFSPLSRDRTWAPQQWKHGVLNAGPPGNSLILMFKSFPSFCLTQPFSYFLGSGTLVHINF